MAEIHLFSGLTGDHEMRLTTTDWDYSDVINEPGSISATLPRIQDGIDMLTRIHPYRHIAAVLESSSDGLKCLHAGYLTQVTKRDEGETMTVSGGGGETILEKRIVANSDFLADRWVDGRVEFDDEGNAKTGDVVGFAGKSSRAIMSHILKQTCITGPLPMINPEWYMGTAGSHTIDYKTYDFPTIASVFRDLGQAENGPEYRFVPTLRYSGDFVTGLSFAFECQDDGYEIIDNKWVMTTVAPRSGVMAKQYDASGSAMCTQYFAVGGKDSDSLYVARSISTNLTSAGWPILMAVDTTHSDISNYDQLKGYANGGVAAGDDEQATRSLIVDRRAYDVHVGDWIDLRESSEQSAASARLKVVGVKGTSATNEIEIECRYRR